HAQAVELHLLVALADRWCGRSGTASRFGSRGDRRGRLGGGSRFGGGGRRFRRSRSGRFGSRSRRGFGGLRLDVGLDVAAGDPPTLAGAFHLREIDVVLSDELAHNGRQEARLGGGLAVSARSLGGRWGGRFGSRGRSLLGSRRDLGRRGRFGGGGLR